MAFSIPPQPLGTRFTSLLHFFGQDAGPPIASVLTGKQIERIARDERFESGTGVDCGSTLPITLPAFVGQYRAGKRTCLAAGVRPSK